MPHTTDQPNQRRTRRAGPGHAAAAATIGAIVIVVIAVGFRGSWGALRDAALAAHFDRAAANLFAVGVDGLIVIAIIAALVLRHEPGARRYCLSVVAGYTGASWLINFLHGLGMFIPDPVSGMRPVPPWPVVLVIATLVIGSIFLGSHLLVFVLRHLFPGAAGGTDRVRAYQPGTDVPLDGRGGVGPARDRVEAARGAYRHSLNPDRRRLSQRELVERFGISRRDAARVQHDAAGEVDVDNGTDAPV